MPNILSSIGRSGAVGDFVKEARMMRQQDTQNAMMQERLGMEREQLGLAIGKDKRDALLTEEQIRAARHNADKLKRQQEEEDRLVIHKPEEWGSKSVNSIIEDHAQSMGIAQKDENGFLTYRNADKQRLLEETQKNPFLRKKLATAYVQSSANQYKKYKAAMDGDKDAINELKQADPEFKPELLPELLRSAELEYGQAKREFMGITAKDEIELARKEAKDKEDAQIRREKERADERHDKVWERIAATNAGANVARADVAKDKAGKKTAPTLSGAEYKNIKEGMDGYADKTQAEKDILNELAIQNGMVITKKKVAQRGLGRLKPGSFNDEYSVMPMSSYKTPDDVKIAFKSGVIDEASATRVLETLFPDKFGG